LQAKQKQAKTGINLGWGSATPGSNYLQCSTIIATRNNNALTLFMIAAFCLHDLHVLSFSPIGENDLGEAVEQESDDTTFGSLTMLPDWGIWLMDAHKPKTLQSSSAHQKGTCKGRHGRIVCLHSQGSEIATWA